MIRAVKTAAKPSHCRTVKVEDLLGCSDLCWCNFRSTSYNIVPLIVAHTVYPGCVVKCKCKSELIEIL